MCYLEFSYEYCFSHFTTTPFLSTCYWYQPSVLRDEQKRAETEKTARQYHKTGPKEAVLLAVSCDAFAFGQEDTNNDRITVEWTNTPDGAAKQFCREWFQGDSMACRKNLPIEYNP